jgi:NTE family protein
MTARNVQTAIVLQGGGALGAYEYGVLKALYESRPGFRPVAVAGISIGAITAAVLGGAAGDPIHALDTLWRRKLTVESPVPAPWLPAPIDQALASFGNPGMYQLQAGLFTTPCRPPSPMCCSGWSSRQPWRDHPKQPRSLHAVLDGPAGSVWCNRR